MKRVPIQELKSRLSALIRDVSRGARLLVTRHGKPVARVEPAEEEHVCVGERAGAVNLLPLLEAPTAGRYLELLDEDRGAP